MQQRIKAGELVPMFRLPDAGGKLVTRQQYRGRANLLIVFLPDLGPATRRYLQALSANSAGWSRSEVALAIAGAPIEQLAPLAAELHVPLLADVEGKVRSQFLPEGVAGAWFATDRWGQLYAQGYVSSSADFPPPEELRGWLEFIACECGG